MIHLKKEDRARLYFNKMELKHRGWTEALIRDFLGEPDEEAENPNNSAMPQKLYQKKRVERIEQTKRFLVAQAASKKRREASKAAAEIRRKETIRLAEAVKIEVPEFEWEELVRRACENYNSLESLGEFQAYPDSDPEFIDRICVNYLRHACTVYDRELDSMSGEVGREEAQEIVRQAVYDKIDDVYPELGSECFRQQKYRSNAELYAY